MFKGSHKLLFISSLIILISFLTFLPSFNLALFGDDWLAIWRYLEHLGPKPTGQWNHLTYFFTPYGAQDILMGFLNSIYGFQSFYYYSISFLFRLFAAFSIYPLVFYLTKSKLAAFFSILFLSITFIGLETTNWVFNMPSYITLALFNLTLYFFIKSEEVNNFKQIFLATFFYYFAYIITPIRMHGSLPFLFLLEFFLFFQKRDLKSIKKSVLRFSIMLAIFLFIKFTGQSLGPANEIPERLTQGYTISMTLLSIGRYDFIFHPLIIFGGMIFPDFLIGQIIGSSTMNITIFFVSFIFLFSFVLTALILSKLSKNISKVFFLRFLIISFTWILIGWFIFPKHIQPFPNNSMSLPVEFILLNIGVYTIIFIVLLLIEKWREETLGVALFISLIWPLLSFIAAWWFTPQIIFPSIYRYLTLSSIGISLLLGIIISFGSGIRKQLYLIALLSPFLFLHITSTNNYFKFMENFRSQQTADKVWSKIPYIPEIGKEPLVFYFESDNYIGLYNIITFGFPPHMQLLYNLSQYDFAPVPMENWSEVISAVKDGQSFKPYGYPLQPIPIDHVYGFRLERKDNLINITNTVRQKLEEEKDE